MGTRSLIGVMHGDVLKSVYCHWDGYLENNGRILLEHYDSAKANQLVALGHISSLGRQLGEEHPFSQFEIDANDPEREAKLARYEYAQAQDWTTFYGRDRKEQSVGWDVDHDFESFMKRVSSSGAEYYYIMKDGEWYCGDSYGNTAISGKLVLLAEALAEHDIENAEESV